ncbi:MAG: tRNA1(Val) (adenine(37)-N6)-methyltransferase [Eubacteriales bacterium]|jgi:tRNA1Val (adenine37-N6)-methyltransferase
MLRLDDLQNGYSIWQDPDLFCFGIDAVLLAHYPALKKHDRILDMGTGFAPVPLILEAENKKRGLGASITGLEIQERAAEIARKSVVYNHVGDDVRIITGDIRTAPADLGAASFTLITCNPPYMAAGDGIIGSDEARAIARTEMKCTLHDVVSSAGRLLVPGGRFAMIHRPFRLPEIFSEMQEVGLSPKRMRLVFPYADAEPSMVLVEAMRGGRPYLRCDAPLVVHNRDRSYTDEILKIYGRK